MIDENRLLEEINKLPYINGKRDKEYADTHFINGILTAHELIADCVKAQPKVNEWIPVTERLPEDGDYLCSFDDGFITRVSFIDGDWELWADSGEVIAWRPLPKPYKEKENVE